MKLKKMGRTGLKVTEVCLGTMTFGHQCDQPTSFAIMDRAWAGGINFIDTADVYPLRLAQLRRSSATGSLRTLGGGMRRSSPANATAP